MLTLLPVGAGHGIRTQISASFKVDGLAIKPLRAVSAFMVVCSIYLFIY